MSSRALYTSGTSLFGMLFLISFSAIFTPFFERLFPVKKVGSL
jgi:hypothetical protein